MFRDPNNTFEYAKQIIENQSINLSLKTNSNITSNEKPLKTSSEQSNKNYISQEERNQIEQNRSSSAHNYSISKSRLRENTLSPIVKDHIFDIPQEQSQFEIGKVIKYGMLFARFYCI